MGKDVRIVWTWTLVLWVAVICLLLASCGQVRYVPVETVKRDSIYLQQVRHDSIVRYDSVYVRDKGDTVWLEKFRYLYRDRLVRDTVYVGRTDTVRVPYPVERQLGRWERVKMEAGGVAMGVLAVALLVVVGWLAVRMRRK